MRFIRLKETPSTNTYISNHLSELQHGDFITAQRQTAGRGQRGNSWESEPGRNLTFSMLARMDRFPAISQFAISEAVALAMVEALKMFHIEAKVKWPNDIYVGDKKICGILIEHSVMGTTLSHTIIGAGLNVNQLRFFSDAPNPVSMVQLKGEEYDLESVTECVAQRLEARLAAIGDEEGREETHREFKQLLWRGDGGFYPFEDTATRRRFDAAITDIEPIGYLHLQEPDSTRHKYAFKEVQFLL